MDMFFGYQFTTYGTDVLRISELPIEERVDPMSKVFPKVRGIERLFIYYLMILYLEPMKDYTYLYSMYMQIGYQVYLPSIWSIRNRRKQRWSVCIGSKHH